MVKDQTTIAPGQALVQLITGGWAMQAVGSLARLRVFDPLAGGPLSVGALAERTNLDAGALHRVLRAVAMLGVVREVAPHTYALEPIGELLRSDAPGSMRALLDAETAPGHWLPWMHLDACLRTGRSQASVALGTDVWSYYAQHPEEGAAFAEGMSGMSAMALAAMDAVYTPPEARRVVDLGGAHGAMLAALLHKLPEARGVLFDLASVVETAGPTLAKHGVDGRVERVSGDFFEAVPEGGDLYVLKHVVHDWDDAQAARILANVRRAIAPGGRVMVVEMVLPEDGSPSPALLLDLNMLVMLPGKERTVGEIHALLHAAGFTPTRVVPTPSPFVVIEAVTR